MSAAACSGKVRFNSMVDANRYARRQRRRREGGYSPYRCRACHGYHVGTHIKAPLDARREQREREEDFA